MPHDQRPDDGDEPDPLLAVVADPERGRRRLPYLLGLLDADEPQRRLTAALALCLVVDESPDLLDAVVRRLVDRLDGDPPIEVPHALDYLAARDPKAVDEAVTDLDEERELLARGHLYQSGAGFARNEYLAPSPADSRSGRTRIAGRASTDDPRQVYTDRSPDGAEDPIADSDEGNGEGDGDEGGGGDGPDAGSSGGDADGDETDDADDADGDDSDADDGPTRGTLALVARRLSDVVERSRFEDLDVLTERRRERYGHRYRAVGRIDGTERPLGLLVFRLPDENQATFARGLHAAVERWAAVDDHESVLTVHDWDVRPRPWAALEHAGLSLADREALPVDEAVASALDLADAVAHVHRRGVVHGSIDPQNVVYPGAALTETERQRPRLANPGLASVYADHVGLANCVDPRYAAPEHYASRFGGVDNATDVYALGAILYRLCTGEPPFDGRPEEVRTGVLSDRSPVPTAVDPSLPDGLDRVVRKATATGKLTRYETVTQFRSELRGVDTDG